MSITDFGLTGPWADYQSSDLVALATSGLLITSGYDDHTIPPIRPGGNQAYHTAASFAHQAVLLALLQRQQNGAGGLIDLSIQEAAGVTVELANPYWFYPRALVQRQTCRHAQPVPTQSAIFQCADGRWVYFALILADPKPWNALVQWMDSLDLAVDLKDPEFDDLSHRQQNFAHIQDLVEVFFLLQDSSDAYLEGQRRGLPIGVLNAPEDLFDDEHLVAREFFQPVDEPGLRHGAHARCPVPLLDAVHGAAPTGRLGSGSTPPRCSTTSGRRREWSAVGGRHALRRERHARTRRFAMPDLRDRHVSPHRCRARAAPASMSRPTRCRPRARSGRSRSNCSPRNRRTRCRAPTSVRTSSGTWTSAAR